jgi:predicted DNA-binding transcriptional regulator AlpA
MTIEPMFLSIDKVIDATGISRSELYRAMSDRRLMFQVVAGRRRITPAALRAYVRGGG